MAQVGPGIVIHQAEGDQQRLNQGVGLLSGVLEGVVVLRALRLLQPVEDILAGPNGVVVEQSEAFGLKGNFGHPS